MEEPAFTDLEAELGPFEPLLQDSREPQPEVRCCHGC